jgi:hypothetical protein
VRVTTTGLDLAKQVFQVHGIDAEGAIVLRRRLRAIVTVTRSGSMDGAGRN